MVAIGGVICVTAIVVMLAVVVLRVRARGTYTAHSMPMSNTSVHIHQIWIHPDWELSDGIHALPRRYQAPVRTWRDVYGSAHHHVYDRHTCRSIVQAYFPRYTSVYDNMEADVQRADMARYVILYVFGGFYADMDTTLYKPITPFVDGTNLHTSIEIRRTPGRHGYTQYAFGSPPRHPALLDVLRGVARAPPRRADESLDAYVIRTTGPVVFSDAINRRVRAFPSPSDHRIVIHREGLFGAYKSWGVVGRTAFLRHHFDGSWKQLWRDVDKDWR
jgi:mannosyltransferase OCH1-like enzyme